MAAAASKSFLVTFTEILSSELSGSGVQVQVVCPGVVRSEFHTRQGIDMSTGSRMEPGSIVDASLIDLERGVVISMPGAPDASLVDRLAQVEAELMASTRATELPQRYRTKS